MPTGSLSDSFWNSQGGTVNNQLLMDYIQSKEWQNAVNAGVEDNLKGGSSQAEYELYQRLLNDSMARGGVNAGGQGSMGTGLGGATNTPSAAAGGGIDSRGGDNMITSNAMGISQIVNATISWHAHNRYADLLESLELDLPDAISQAETGYRQLARRGLPGIDQYKQDVNNLFAQAMTEADKTGNLNTRMGQLQTSQKMVTDALTKLNLQDMSQQMRNQLTLLKFLDSVKAPYEQNIKEFDIQKTLAAQQERMKGTQEAMQGATNATFDISNSINDIIGMAAGGM